MIYYWNFGLYYCLSSRISDFSNLFLLMNEKFSFYKYTILKIFEKIPWCNRPIPFGSKAFLPLFSLHLRRALTLPFLSSRNRRKILTKIVSTFLNGIGVYVDTESVFEFIRKQKTKGLGARIFQSIFSLFLCDEVFHHLQ